MFYDDINVGFGELLLVSVSKFGDSSLVDSFA